MPLNPGRMANFQALKEDPAALGIIIQRIAAGESLRSICRAWEIPHREVRKWLTAQGRALVNARRSTLYVIQFARSNKKPTDEGLI